MPHNPYAVAKLYGHLMVSTYRERYGMHASSRDPLQPRVATPAAGVRQPQGHARPRRRSSSASPTSCSLGDLEARRDWSFAGDVAEAMWLMLQQDAGDDYVVCSGVSRTVRELVDDGLRRGRPRPRAPTSWSIPSSCARAIPVPLVGDPSKARAQLGWEPRTSFEDLIRMMVEHDLRELSQRARVRSDLALLIARRKP